MGVLKNIIKSNESSFNHYSQDLIGLSNFIIYQNNSDIYLGKCRYGNNGFVDLPEALELIIKDYYYTGTEKLTNFEMFNISIREELEEAIEKVLIKHGIKKR